MYWFAVIILTAVMVSLQGIVAPRLEVFGARPDWLLVLVAFMGLYGSPRRSIIAGWFVGMCADLMSIERLGLLSLSYGLVALLLVGARDHIFRFSLLTQLAATFVLGVALRGAWLTYVVTVYDSPMVRASTQVILGSAYSALWAPPLHAAGLRAARLLGVPRLHRGPLGLTELSYTDV